MEFESFPTGADEVIAARHARIDDPPVPTHPDAAAQCGAAPTPDGGVGGRRGTGVRDPRSATTTTATATATAATATAATATATATAEHGRIGQ